MESAGSGLHGAGAAPADEVDDFEEVQEDEYDEDDKEMYGMYQALPIPDGEPDWESGEAPGVFGAHSRLTSRVG